jgi:hypothetical protein
MLDADRILVPVEHEFAITTQDFGRKTHEFPAHVAAAAQIQR